jgi:hypothetical protein
MVVAVMAVVMMVSCGVGGHACSGEYQERYGGQ